MSHVVLPNQPIFAQNELFTAIWKLTRGLLAAGWRYKASGDATGATKDTSGTFANDRWGVGGGVNLVQVGAQTGTAPTIGAPSNGNSTITLVSGFTANSVGRFLTIANALNSGNNGTFRIVSQTGTTVTIFNPSAVSEVGSASVTWTEKQGGAAASISAAGTNGAIPGRAIVTGLTGMVSPTTAPLNRGSTGDRLTIIGAASGVNNGTFLITRVISASSVEIDNASAVTDANNGSLIWVETSPTAQVYATHLQGATGQGAWINLQGPSLLKIPMGMNTPTGTFVKGEVINETTSGAQGVIIGVCPDTSGGLGYIVVEPRLNGTGGGVRGWSTGADTVTGATSGATLAIPGGTVPVEYVVELVFWKNTATNGHAYMQCVDSVGESTSRFSSLATQAATTATICPGGATGTFPTPGSWVFQGTGGSNAAGTGSAAWYLTATLTNLGLYHIICANNIEGSGVSMDGSWIVLQGTPSGAPSTYTGGFFQRCDDGEEGDVCPYVTYAASNGGAYPMNGSTRTTNTGSNSNTSNYDIYRIDTFIAAGTSFTPYKSFRRRGFPTSDAYQEYQGYTFGSGANVGVLLSTANAASPTRVATQATANVFIRDAIWIASTQVNQKQRKGYLRWIVSTEGGVTNNTYANGTWLQAGTSLAGPCVVGPWDGQTAATNG